MKDNKKEKLKAFKKADKKLKKGNGKKSKKKSKKALGIGLGLGAAVILAGYAGVGVYYQDKFYPGTMINGIDCGGKDTEYVRELLKKKNMTVRAPAFLLPPSNASSYALTVFAVFPLVYSV